MAEKIISSNYGSIPHLSISKMSQQADKKIVMGQELILTKKARDWKDLIIVTEKLDGSNVGVLKQNGKQIAITRAGYSAESSPHKQHREFEYWRWNNWTMFDWLPEGWRICGEWMAMAHGTIYDITDLSPFVAFDIITDKGNRLPYLSFLGYCIANKIPMVPLVHIGQPITIKRAMEIVGQGIYGKPEKPEGVVYRVERDGRVDFMAKFVREDKEDGKYMEQQIWNTGFKPEL
jgi:ATP-dependent RNA circularization protein (DNA/RNA ligase family)